jgi:transposase
LAAFLVPRRSAVVRWRGTLDGLIPEQHLARFVWRALSSLDFAELEYCYPSVRAGPGRPPYHPQVLAALWVYGMTQGLETAVDIATACAVRDDFRWLAGGLVPSDQTLLNFLGRTQTALASIWEQLLRAMHEAGHIDLSAIAEDGVKLRANASPRSFLTAPEIEQMMERLRARIAVTVNRLASGEATGEDRKVRAELRGLQSRLSRADRAVRELDQRMHRREERGSGAASSTASTAPRGGLRAGLDREAQVTPFTRQDFRHVPERNVVICPTEQELRFIGQYPTDNGRGTYRLFGRSDCADCPQKLLCTDGKGRRIKLLVDVQEGRQPPAPAESNAGPDTPTKAAENGAAQAGGEHSRGPVASVTEPEALMMLATSEKRWEPSYNADLSVTRHGIIVSQFLTKQPTDFHNFEPAVRAVLSTLGKPDSWIGDGHYGTQANVLLADREGVLLYAPRAGSSGADSSPATAPPEKASNAVSPSAAAPQVTVEKERFDRQDFQHEPERDVLVCPTGQDLRLIGVYATDNGMGVYRLYGRADCEGCAVKGRCTDGKGRRVKMPALAQDRILPPKATSPEAALGTQQDLCALLEALDSRMQQVGDAVRRFRGRTVEPVNGQLKQHGLGRFHVHGLTRCAAVLTLACIGHNLMKWRAREAACSIRAIAS